MARVLDQSETTMKAVYVRFFCAVLLVVTATMAAAARAAGATPVHTDTVVAQAGPSL